MRVVCSDSMLQVSVQSTVNYLFRHRRETSKFHHKYPSSSQIPCRFRNGHELTETRNRPRALEVPSKVMFFPWVIRVLCKMQIRVKKGGREGRTGR